MKAKANELILMSKKRHPISDDFGKQPPKLTRQDVAAKSSPKMKSLPVLEPMPRIKMKLPDEEEISGDSTEGYSDGMVKKFKILYIFF